MNKKMLFNLLRNAKKCGINTLGELAEYKKYNMLRTNMELNNQLFLDAMIAEVYGEVTTKAG